MATATVTITLRLPEELVDQIDAIARRGERNAFICRVLRSEVPKHATDRLHGPAMKANWTSAEVNDPNFGKAS